MHQEQLPIIALSFSVFIVIMPLIAAIVYHGKSRLRTNGRSQYEHG
jgi:hypothetical protein